MGRVERLDAMSVSKANSTVWIKEGRRLKPQFLRATGVLACTTISDHDIYILITISWHNKMLMIE